MKDALRNIYKSTVIAAIGLAGGFAQDSPKLNIRIEDFKFNMTAVEKSDSTLVSYAPGDTILYVITASNEGDALMKNPVIVDPIPTGVTYVENSANGDNSKISFSIDQGSAYLTWPPYYTVRNSKGLLVKRAASPDMVTHIKWDINIELKPKESTVLEFLVVVNK